MSNFSTENLTGVVTEVYGPIMRMEVKMISSKNTDEEKNQEDWSGFELKLMKEIFNLIKKSAHSREHGLQIITHIFCSFMIGITKDNPEFSYKKVLKAIDEKIEKGSLK